MLQQPSEYSSTLQQLFIFDSQIHSSIVQLQSNILNFLEVQIEKEQIKNLMYGFKDEETKFITESVRETLVILEKYISMGLYPDTEYKIDSELIHFYAYKFRENGDYQDLNFDIGGSKTSLKRQQIENKNVTFSHINIQSNIFKGSNYV